MAKINKQHYKDVNMTRLETWLGKEKIAKLQADMKGWYGRPICLLDVPGSVWIHADGHFTGTMQRGYFYSALDSLEEWAKRFWAESGRLQYGQCNAGFTSIADALLRSRQGNEQRIIFNRTSQSTTASWSTSTWRLNGGASSAAAPGGSVPVSTTTGSIAFNNPPSGTLHLVGATVNANNSNSILLYDRLFTVAKTMNSTTTEAVTGVPTRYQSTTATDADYVGDNFLFIETAVKISNTAHNWTVCQYTNQAGTATKELPSVTGIADCAQDRLDMPVSSWFAPLADNDTGIKDLTQMQCSASLAVGSINFTIGHPIGFMSFPVASFLIPFDWLTNREQAPRIFDNACLAVLEPCRVTGISTRFEGFLNLVSAAA